MTAKLTPLQKAMNRVTKAYVNLTFYEGDDLGEYERLAQKWHEAVDAFLDLEEQEHVQELRTMRGL